LCKQEVAGSSPAGSIPKSRSTNVASAIPDSAHGSTSIRIFPAKPRADPGGQQANLKLSGVLTHAASSQGTRP
ncbi:MAG: hypothetical protein ABSH51_22370, partial [Solirubrobacteraceae bacterium]